MSVIYLFLKIFPFFGISFGILSFDLARNMRRKANVAWVPILMFSIACLALTGVWFYFHGFINADRWFLAIKYWFDGR